MRTAVLLALAFASAGAALLAGADEMSGDDKLRILYSHRFSFTRSGVPLVTVELMHGEKQVALRADRPLRVLPDGDGGAEVIAGPSWTVTAEKSTPAKVRYWTVVSRQAGDGDEATWKSRGYPTHVFETGIVFGVEGDVIDSRARLLGVAPEATEAAAQKAAHALAEKWHVETSVQPELVARPSGTLVAREAGGTREALPSGGRSAAEPFKGAVVRNEGVVWFAPEAEGGTITVADLSHGGGGARAGAARDDRAFRGRLYVTFDTDGALSVVNALPEDQLLAGIVPSEIFPDAPAEALKAQAVAARDELLAKIGTRHLLDPFLLCATQHCQVYGGITPEDPRTSRAVEATRGQVLLREGGGLVEAYYSASCGGFGESNENVWGTPPDPSLRGRLDALGADATALKAFAGGITDENIGAFLAAGEKTFCGRGKHAQGRSRWTVRLPAAELDRLVAAEYADVGHVRELHAVRRGVSGRIVELLLIGERGRATASGELHIRRLLGGLKSSLFIARAESDGWTLDGAGFGHGVGLCQTGAIGMAESGFTHAQILQHYFPGSHLRKLY